MGRSYALNEERCVVYFILCVAVKSFSCCCCLPGLVRSARCPRLCFLPFVRERKPVRGSDIPPTLTLLMQLLLGCLQLIFAGIRAHGSKQVKIAWSAVRETILEESWRGKHFHPLRVGISFQFGFLFLGFLDVLILPMHVEEVKHVRRGNAHLGRSRGVSVFLSFWRPFA